MGGAALRPPLSALPHGHQCHCQLFASLACGMRSSPFLWRNSYLIFTLNEAFRFLFKAVKLDMKTHVEMSQAYVGVGRGVNRLQNNWTSVDSCASIRESWAAKERVVEIVDLERRGQVQVFRTCSSKGISHHHLHLVQMFYSGQWGMLLVCSDWRLLWGRQGGSLGVERGFLCDWLVCTFGHLCLVLSWKWGQRIREAVSY